MTLMSRPPAGAKTTILVVDGAANGRTHTASMLRNLGYAVESSGDAFYALALLAGETPVRAIVVDIDPGADFDARTLVSQALMLRPNLPVVLYTANAAKFANRMITSKLRILAKPFNPNELAKAVADAVKIAMHRNVHDDKADAASTPNSAAASSAVEAPPALT